MVQNGKTAGPGATNRMSEELDKEVSPFTVRDALVLHDKRINQLTDLSHESQAVVKNFEEKMKMLLERINMGISPTMQIIKDQNSDIRTQIVEFKGDVNTRFKDMEGKLAINQEHFESKIREIDDWMLSIKDMVWKVAGSLITISIVGLIGMYVYVHTMQSQIGDIIPAIRNLNLSKPGGK